jgi:ATP-dependent Clp protease ATP-binding subunit ClpB
VLFDEIEKAHGDVFNVLLQLLDEGRLTDSQGRTVDFKNCIIVMTSNLGASQGHEAIQAALKQFFRPEFLNRIDDIVEFNPIESKNMLHIVRIQLKEVVSRLKEKQIDITFSDEACKWLAEKGFDPQFGARPLKRLVQNEVLNPLAKKLIAQEIKPMSKVAVTAKDNHLVFES